MLNKIILQTIATTLVNNPAGFTIDFSGNWPTSGYCVADAATQNSFGPAGTLRAARYAQDHGLYLGGWYDTKSGQYYLDATHVIQDLETALALAREHGQLAIFDLNTCEEIRL